MAKHVGTVLLTLFTVGALQPACAGFQAGSSEGIHEARLAGRSLDRADAHVVFVENRGQWEVAAEYLAQFDGGWVRAEPAGIGLQISGKEAGSGVYLRLTFEGASPHVVIEPRLAQEALYSFFLGNDPERWAKGLRGYGELCYRGLYPGIDLVLRGSGRGIKYDLVLAPGADLSQVVVRCEGQEALRIEEGEEERDVVMEMETAVGEVRHPLGACFEVRDGREEPTTCRLVPLGATRFGFERVGTPSGGELVIDPELVWSTYLGGSGVEGVWGVDVTPQGNVVVCGFVLSPNFPTTPGAYQHPSANQDVFVSCLRGSDSSLVYSTRIGGTADFENAYGVSVDVKGRATVAGLTRSTDFPTTPGAWDRQLGGILDTFVLRLSARGDELVYSTYLGGAGPGEFARTVEVFPDGSAVVGGWVSAGSFPVTPGAFDTTSPPQSQVGFLTKLDPTGSSLVWSTLLGGSSTDYLFDTAVGADGSVTVTGWTQSTDFPTTPGAFHESVPSFPSSIRAFVTRFSADGSHLLWSTYLGSDGPFTPDHASGVAVGPDGDAFVIGRTTAPDFPVTPGAFQTVYAGTGGSILGDAFVTRIHRDGGHLVYSTYLGGSDGDGSAGVSVDASGVLTLNGGARSFDFPLTEGAFDSTPPKALYVGRLDPWGRRLLYSSFLGGSPLGEEVSGSAVLADGSVVITASSTGPGYPVTPGAHDTTFNGGSHDVVVTRMDLLPQGVRRIGRSLPGSRGPLTMGVLGFPRAGDRFGFWCSGAPPNADGWLLVQPGSGFAELSLETGLDPAKARLALPVRSGPHGWAETKLELPATWSETTLTAVFAFEDHGEPRPAASHGLVVKVE